MLHTLTDGAYKQRALARTKSLHTALSKKAASRTRHVWRLHSLASPVTCVSIRGQQGHFGRTAPIFGTRWVIQTCMKFDTWQVRTVNLFTKPLRSFSPVEPRDIFAVNFVGTCTEARARVPGS
jgi:hypothetical protein